MSYISTYYSPYTTRSEGSNYERSLQLAIKGQVYTSEPSDRSRTTARTDTTKQHWMGPFVRGRIATKWGLIIQHHLLTLEMTKSFTQEKWGTQLIKICWTYVLQMWDIRNKELHRGTKAKQLHSVNII
jgi:hypothetical protein